MANREKGRHYTLRIGVVLLIMLDTLRHIFSGTRPIDAVMLVVELLVLAIIAVEALVHLMHWFKIRRRMKRLRERFAEGQALHHAPPSMGTAPEEALAWNRKVEAWIDVTKALLDGYSAQASMSFQHDPGREFRLAATHKIATAAELAYTRLQDCLNNLREIIENPDVYL